MSQLTTLVETQAESLRSRWVECVRSGIGPGQPEPELLDHVALFLGELAGTLRRGQLSAHRVPASEPGQPRYRLAVDLGRLVVEYGLLHNVILDVAEEQHLSLARGEVRLLSDATTQAMAEAVTEHQRRFEDAREALLACEQAARTEAQTSEAQLRLVTDALPVLVSFVTADERYAFVNKAYEDWFDQGREALVDHHLRDIIGEEAYALLHPYVRRGLDGERFQFEQHGVAYRTGGTRDIRASFVPHHDASGRVDGYISFIEDISAARRLEAERERLARQRTEILESMGDAFFTLDAQWRFLLVNQNYEKVTRQGREQTLGRLFWEECPEAARPDCQYYQQYHRCMTERVPVHFVDYYAPLDIWTEVRAQPTAEGGLAVFFRDISAQKSAEESLRRQTEFEKHLIGIVSHDLRNPLNAILLGAGVLLSTEGLDSRSLRIATRIRSSAERAGRMIRDLLDFTQARLGGGIRLEPRPTNLHELVRAAMDEIGATFPDRQVRVREEGDGQGQWDPDRLAQVVQNLVTNALKYSPPDSTVTVVSKAEGDGMTLCVHNGGAPIPPDRLPQLFEPFQRAVAQTDSISRSVGLGLYIVKEVVAAHHGAVEVESSAEQGTTFRVRLPRTPPPARAS